MAVLITMQAYPLAMQFFCEPVNQMPVNQIQ